MTIISEFKGLKPLCEFVWLILCIVVVNVKKMDVHCQQAVEAMMTALREFIMNIMMYFYMYILNL